MNLKLLPLLLLAIIACKKNDANSSAPVTKSQGQIIGYGRLTNGASYIGVIDPITAELVPIVASPIINTGIQAAMDENSNYYTIINDYSTSTSISHLLRINIEAKTIDSFKLQENISQLTYSPVTKKLYAFRMRYILSLDLVESTHEISEDTVVTSWSWMAAIDLVAHPTRAELYMSQVPFSIHRIDLSSKSSALFHDDTGMVDPSYNALRYNAKDDRLYGIKRLSFPRADSLFSIHTVTGEYQSLMGLKDPDVIPAIINQKSNEYIFLQRIHPLYRRVAVINLNTLQETYSPVFDHTMSNFVWRDHE